MENPLVKFVNQCSGIFYLARGDGGVPQTEDHVDCRQMETPDFGALADRLAPSQPSPYDDILYVFDPVATGVAPSFSVPPDLVAVHRSHDTESGTTLYNVFARTTGHPQLMVTFGRGSRRGHPLAVVYPYVFEPVSRNGNGETLRKKKRSRRTLGKIRSIGPGLDPLCTYVEYANALLVEGHASLTFTRHAPEPSAQTTQTGDVVVDHVVGDTVRYDYVIPPVPTGAERRFHTVRGHFRKYKGHTTWIDSHTRGNPSLGTVHKSIRLGADREAARRRERAIDGVRWLNRSL